MDWWNNFDLWEFIIHPMQYIPPAIDAWIREWGRFIDAFVAANPWFCTFMAGTGMSWFTWLVMKTPWNWDNKWPDWVKKHIFKQNVPAEKEAEARATMKREIHTLTDEIK